MKLVKPALPPNCVETPDGGFYARVKVGANNSPTKKEDFRKFDPPATVEDVLKWQADRRVELEAERAPKAVKGTLTHDVETEYPQRAKLTPANKKRRLQQQRWWLAQLVAMHAPVLTPVAFRNGKRLEGRTFGELPRHKVAEHLDRIEQILAQAFAARRPSIDPTENAGTSNHYRMALLHLFTVLDKHKPEPNPIKKIETRATRGAQRKSQDLRVIAEILRQTPSGLGPKSRLGELRLAVLAYVHIAPIQLMRMGQRADWPAPDLAFHDVPGATEEEILDGVITVTVPPRFKGRRKVMPEPETIPVTRRGADALRAFAAEPKAWGTFSLPSLNKAVKRGARLAQAALLKQGYKVDLSGFSVYHLKHSLATVASVASGSVVDRGGKIKQNAGVQKFLGHAKGRTTAIYTYAATDPLLIHVNRCTGIYLDQLFTQPLVAASLTVTRRKRA